MKTLNASEIKAIAKELKVKNWWNKKRQVLVEEIAAIKGWENEKPEIIEFLLAGGEIEALPEAPQPVPKNSREDSAGGKAPQKKKPRKAKKNKEKKKEKTQKDENLVTLKGICEELGVEGRIARRKLRGSDIEKPEGQWAWPVGHEDIDRVKELIK